MNGYVFTLGGDGISWKLSKQTCVEKSTVEFEFIVLDKTREEVEWLQNVLEVIPRWPKIVLTICFHCNSEAKIGWAQSVMYNGKSRYIRWRHNTVRQMLSHGLISLSV